MKLLAWATIWSALALVMSGCGSDSAGGDATAKIQFNNATARFFTLGTSGIRPVGTPNVFKMKMIAAYLTEDIAAGTGNNVGQTTMVWLNTQCADDIMHCNTDNTSNGGNAEDGQPWAHVVTDFFDFSDPAAANTALNSQGRSIQSGTYKYARLEFCKWVDGSSQPNIQWQADADGVTAPPKEFARPSCTVDSQQFNPPLTIPSGGSATITLTYDLSTAVGDGTILGVNCFNGTSGIKCFNPPTFTPSATL